MYSLNTLAMWDLEQHLIIIAIVKPHNVLLQGLKFATSWLAQASVSMQGSLLQCTADCSES